ncbi:hypothetical protein SAMN05444126_10690 [Salisediminibacterium halotolerans]|uniref:Uncharacterized protein n=1 Tax=Salisediminibacterium halotolerans TaxID=517425 RepID=A0A1H9S8Q0_9BACI|nr:hypothetical protein SAMN05444126_10690 [Salisediminibacterium haloalkalitolerans]
MIKQSRLFKGGSQLVDKVMTSIDVMLKGTDDCASSGFFPREKPGCWVILLF